MLKNYNEDDVLAKTLLLYFAFQHGAVGVFLVFGDKYLLEVDALKGMAMLLPMDAWGGILLISSVSFVMAVLQANRTEYWWMITAGVMGMIPFSLLSMASIELSPNQINTINYMIIASIDVLVAIIGGVGLWLRRTMLHTEK